jgi:hypothetical protein
MCYRSIKFSSYPLLLISISFLLCISSFAQKKSSQLLEDSKKEVWVSDNGNGTYNNPIIYSDYSDPDVIRVGDDYYQLEYC